MYELPDSLTRCRVSVAQWWNTEGLRFDSSPGLFFPLFHTREKAKKHLSLFLYQAQNLPSLSLNINLF